MNLGHGTRSSPSRWSLAVGGDGRDAPHPAGRGRYLTSPVAAWEVKLRPDGLLTFKTDHFPSFDRAGGRGLLLAGALACSAMPLNCVSIPRPGSRRQPQIKQYIAENVNSFRRSGETGQGRTGAILSLGLGRSFAVLYRFIPSSSSAMASMLTQEAASCQELSPPDPGRRRSADQKFILCGSAYDKASNTNVITWMEIEVDSISNSLTPPPSTTSACSPCECLREIQVASRYGVHRQAQFANATSLKPCFLHQRDRTGGRRHAEFPLSSAERAGRGDRVFHVDDGPAVVWTGLPPARDGGPDLASPALVPPIGREKTCRFPAGSWPRPPSRSATAVRSHSRGPTASP